MNHLVQPKVLWQAILHRDRSSGGKSCLEQGKIFELESHNSIFNISIFETSVSTSNFPNFSKPHEFQWFKVQLFNLRNLLSCTVSTFKFQTSCLIKSATVVSSFPFWPNSGQYSTILIQRRTNEDPPFHPFVFYEPCIITQEAFVIQRCHSDCGEALRAETIEKGMSQEDKRFKTKSQSNQ